MIISKVSTSFNEPCKSRTKLYVRFWKVNINEQNHMYFLDVLNKQIKINYCLKRSTESCFVLEALFRSLLNKIKHLPGKLATVRMRNLDCQMDIHPQTSIHPLFSNGRRVRSAEFFKNCYSRKMIAYRGRTKVSIWYSEFGKALGLWFICYTYFI